MFRSLASLFCYQFPPIVNKYDYQFSGIDGTEIIQSVEQEPFLQANVNLVS